MYGIVILGFGPLLYGLVYYCGDVWRYLTKDEDEDTSEMDIELWQVSTNFVTVTFSAIFVTNWLFVINFY